MADSETFLLKKKDRREKSSGQFVNPNSACVMCSGEGGMVRQAEQKHTVDEHRDTHPHKKLSNSPE